MSYIFSRESCSYISGNGNSEKIFYIFLKENFPYMLGNGKSEKIPYISGNVTFLYFRKQNFCSSKKLAQKKLLKFQEMELFRPKLKKLLTFQGVTRKARKINKKIYSEEICYIYTRSFASHFMMAAD